MVSFSVHELRDHIAENQDSKDILYIDVRTPSEFRSECVNAFKNIPLDELDAHLEDIKTFNTVVLSCASGNRSSKAYEQLKYHGVNVINVEGGITAWKNANFPINKGKTQAISIMRQVQIIVGGGTLLGAIFAYFYSINFIFLSGFLGAGLLFAGVTNTCALAAFLSKMPFNK
jgi:rhodanese-related sulfurtransferase